MACHWRGVVPRSSCIVRKPKSLRHPTGVPAASRTPLCTSGPSYSRNTAAGLERLDAQDQGRLVLVVDFSRGLFEIPVRLLCRHIALGVMVVLVPLVFSVTLSVIGLGRSFDPVAAAFQHLGLPHPAIARRSALFAEEEATWREDRHDRVDRRGALSPASFLCRFRATVGTYAQRPRTVGRSVRQEVTTSAGDATVTLAHWRGGGPSHGSTLPGTSRHR